MKTTKVLINQKLTKLFMVDAYNWIWIKPLKLLL